ncbi:MAG: PAS domain S-box protein, partial [Ignavibacteria bacterium]|nr:PAS domain S-box protein [Ignavibacteria bacterium]
TLNQKSFNQLKEDLQQIHFFKKQILILNNLGNEIPVDASFLLGDQDILISLSAVSKETKREDFRTLEENFRNFVTKADVIVLRLNSFGIIEYLNPAYTSQLNFKEEEAFGKNLNEFLAPESKLDFESYQDKSYNLELELLNKRSEKIHYTANIIPLYSENILDGFNIYLINLSGKKEEEKDLQLFKSLFENTKEGIAVENKGKVIAANNSFGKMFGYSFGNEITGKDILDLAATNDVLKIAEYLQLYQAKKELSRRFEFSGKRKDGSTFFAELTPSSFEIDGSWYLVLIIRDITERKRAQQVIRESEEKYRNLIENIDDFLFTLDRSKLFFKPVFFTGAVNKITGFSQTEMLNDIKFLLKIIHPDDLLNVKENLKSFSKSRIKMSAELEFRIINKQGNVVWVRNKLSVIRNEKGEVQKVYGLVSDISLRRKAEEDLKKSTQNLVKLNETKDRFISIISHDLRTPFSSILGFTDLILHDDTLSDKERNQYVSYIQESSNAMLSLVNSLLDWTRLQTGRIRFEPEKVEASEVISKSINALGGAAFQKSISINSNVHENLYVYVDKDLIGQVFNNLISNAIKFTREDGSIIISAVPSQHTRFYEFSIKDTGVGIKPEDAKKLFGVDTKFTTEGTAGEKGTGLGLSLVKEIIEKHGGTIRVKSEPGSGSDFLFTLPVAAANILLVDSSTTDRILYSKILKHITSDYNIDTASNGREALNKIFALAYALIITEHNMPVMGGYDLALELKKLDMKVKPPIIVLSNSIDRQTIEDYNEIGIEQVFQKPVNLSIFKQAVEKSLHQGLK